MIALFYTTTLTNLATYSTSPIRHRKNGLPSGSKLRGACNVLHDAQDIQSRIHMFLARNGKFIASGFCCRLAGPLKSTLSLRTTIGTKRNRARHALLPRTGCSFPSNGGLSVTNSTRRSTLGHVHFFTRGLTPNRCCLPLAITTSTTSTTSTRQRAIGCLLAIHNLRVNRCGLGRRRIFAMFCLGATLCRPLLMSRCLVSGLSRG